jgi:hypothetical protein
VIYTPGINDFLSFAPLTLGDWGWVLGASGIFLFAHEMIKLLKRKRSDLGL